MKVLHKSEIFFYLLLAFVSGIAAGSFWVVSGRTVLVLCLAGTVVLAIFGYHKTFGQSREGIKKRKFGFLVGFLVLIFVFGLFRFNQFNSNHSRIAEFADRIVGGKPPEFAYRGYVSDIPEIRSGKIKFSFRVMRVVAYSRQITVDDDILVTANLANIKFGDKLVIFGVLKRPGNYSDFDYINYLKKDNITFVLDYPGNIKRDDDPLSAGLMTKLSINIYKNIFYIKNGFESAISKSIPEPQSSFVNGILFGARQDISTDLKNSFSITGTSHILAISGYNIAIISWVLLEYFLLYFMKRKKAFWVTVLFIFIFTVMTGASASVVRAAIMGLVLLFAHGYGRLYDPKNSLLFAAAGMIFVNPFLLRLDIGFQLSFLAVMGLVYLYPVLRNWFKKIPEIFNLKEMLLVTLSAQIFVAPLLAYYFHSFSVISLLANILILPFIPAAMLLGFITGIGGMIFLPIGRILGYFTWAITKYQIGIIENLASVSHASMVWDLSLAGLLFCYVLMIFFVWRFHVPD